LIGYNDRETKTASPAGRAGFPEVLVFGRVWVGLWVDLGSANRALDCNGWRPQLGNNVVSRGERFPRTYVRTQCSSLLELRALSWSFFEDSEKTLIWSGWYFLLAFNVRPGYLVRPANFEGEGGGVRGHSCVSAHEALGC